MGVAIHSRAFVLFKRLHLCAICVWDNFSKTVSCCCTWPLRCTVSALHAWHRCVWGMVFSFFIILISRARYKSVPRFDSCWRYNFLSIHFLKIKDIHNSWLYCFTNPLELGTRVSLSHRQLNVLIHIHTHTHVLIHIRLTMRKRNTCPKFKRISETI